MGIPQDVSFPEVLNAIVPLDDGDRAIVAAHVSTRGLATGEAWLRAGEVCHGVALVTRGILRAHVLTDEGRDVSAYFTSEGGMVSDYDSFLSQRPSRLFLTAAEACDLQVLSRVGIERLYARTGVGDRLGRVIAERLAVAAHRRLMSFYLDSPETRYRQLIDDQPELLQRLAQHQIASYVGVRPQSLSRIRARMRGGAG